MNDLQSIHDSLMCMYGADLVLEALADVDRNRDDAGERRLLDLCVWLGEWRIQEVMA